MAVDSVSPVALDKAASAWAEAVAAVDADVQAHAAAELPRPPGVEAPHPAGDAFVERILGHADSDVAAAPARPAGTQADHGPETANAQTYAKPPSSAPDPVHDTDSRLPSALNAHSEFAVPAALLVPATLIGLQVEPASWPLARHGTDVPARAEPAVTDRDDGPADDEADDAATGESTEAQEDTRREPAIAAAIEAPAAEGWCEALTRSLRAALAARIPPQALLVAAEQWRRSRCVVLACPQGADPAGAAWAFVLWPRKVPQTQADRARHVQPLALYGLRVEAKLQWSSPPQGAAHWCHVRVVKEHHPKRGRQLISVGTAGASAPVACEVQLGPVLARSLRWCEVCVHINAAKRFWAALGAQWSAHVVVCSRPLVGRSAAAREETAC